MCLLLERLPLGSAADLAICGAAMQAGGGGKEASGFPLWAAAEEAHALAALALDADAPATLPPLAAARLIRAARRCASGQDFEKHILRRAEATDRVLKVQIRGCLSVGQGTGRYRAVAADVTSRDAEK